MKKNILIVLHKESKCGVYEFGKNLSEVLQKSIIFNFVKVECSNITELKSAIKLYNPICIIYNYQPSVFPWISQKVLPKLRLNKIANISIPQIGIIHEITQELADSATNYKKKYLINATLRLANSIFDYYIAPDPTLLLFNPIVFKTGRLISNYNNSFPIPDKPTIGSFGFAYEGKGFEEIVELVNMEFDDAIIRFNIPSGDFVDNRGEIAKNVIERCKLLNTKKGIKLEITNNYFDKFALLDFLAKNSINIFYNKDKLGRGISSTIDLALAVKRPIAVSNSTMFRHILDVTPSICLNNNSINNIIINGFDPLEHHYNDWTEENLIWEYERIITRIISSGKDSQRLNLNLFRKMQKEWNRFLSKPDISFTWLRSTNNITDDDMSFDKSLVYLPVETNSTSSFNRILDNDARDLYKPTIDFLKRVVPKTLAKKIPEANVQQAFVFDTVFKFSKEFDNPRMLCVGSYEDTASMSLKRMNFPVIEIDPVINYTIQDFYNKPSTTNNSFEIIFSTSVIEHDSNDVTFIGCISKLLAPGGYAILTCDFKEGWVEGEPIPECNARFYSEKDFLDRLLPAMGDCELIGKPNWVCPNPDFYFDSKKYNYTFATFVVRKIR